MPTSPPFVYLIPHFLYIVIPTHFIMIASLKQWEILFNQFGFFGNSF